MTLQQVNFRDRQSGQLVAGYTYDRIDSQFALVFANTDRPPVTLVTDLHVPMAQRLQLFQTLLRRPSADSAVVTYTETPIAYEVVIHQCVLVTSEVSDEATSIPNTTVAVGDAHVDIDAFGAECQLAMENNRWVDTNLEIARRTFQVLDARLVVDSETGGQYPAITTEGGPYPLFWALPQEYIDWVVNPATCSLFPCICVFGHDQQGSAKVDTYVRMER
ncbi:hypothetical protein [Lacticaseibacillus thailandensis]|uniref:Uncharacterized protein n=1 Tax=Lacticaseibacillus thailandensis DSM 22698 = JCM 13996 TaxID=1423810 RepID=A0A0R2C5E2_9LACO|nr:hypothetical protein [Lacticaseibacillus thailandensis]KRM87087.1 hypothetical protein FD19_GL001238 [Lacticaseibacillus thailandensis DSM 22698 = JCM 13996]